jgi:hypothetical protein
LKRWNANSKLCQLLLDAEYRERYVKFANLPQNRKRRTEMLSLASQSIEVEDYIQNKIHQAENR